MGPVLALAALAWAGPIWGQAKVSPSELTAAKSLGSREAPITIEVLPIISARNAASSTKRLRGS